MDTFIFGPAPISGLWTAIAGGLVGGALGALAAIYSSYFGPRKLEEWRAKQKDEQLHGPRKRLAKNTA
jgi:gas vesicle protein